MTDHPSTSTVRRVVTINDRWVITLSCGHKVRVDKDSIVVREGEVFPCPERPIAVVYE